jgi:HAD superfamily hydrolase (TIGR01509 family)
VSEPALLFDLDGTLVDSVYQHVLAWHTALIEVGFDMPVWRIHRKVGMTGGLMLRALSRELDRDLDADTVERLKARHQEEFSKSIHRVKPLPGARELLAELRESKISYAIATSATKETAAPMLEMLGIDDRVAVITGESVHRAKPDPESFMLAAKRVGVRATDALVVGDSVWDMLAAQRAKYLGIGLLSGGYSQQELQEAGAFRVYLDPADLQRHLDELGIQAE